MGAVQLALSIMQAGHLAQVEQLVVERAAAEQRAAEVEKQLRNAAAEGAAMAARLAEEREGWEVCGRWWRGATIRMAPDGTEIRITSSRQGTRLVVVYVHLRGEGGGENFAFRILLHISA